MIQKNYCYAKESTYRDMSIGEVWCVKLYRWGDDKRIPGFFENKNDADLAVKLLNNLYRELA